VVVWFQIAGVVLAGLLLAGILRVRGPGITRGLQAIPPAASVLALALFWVNVWPAAKSYIDLWRASRHTPASAASISPGVVNGLNEGFLEWARAHLRAGETFALAPEQSTGTLLYQWATYRLAPHQLAVPAAADAIVFYGAGAKDLRRARPGFSAPLLYAPGFGIAWRRHAR